MPAAFACICPPRAASSRATLRVVPATLPGGAVHVLGTNHNTRRASEREGQLGLLLAADPLAS